ncbi:MAG: hypothetical protein V2I32_09965 [Desulforhopalus sp.]|nr:hypothetical protein [Desulforhopalus sp.]
MFVKGDGRSFPDPDKVEGPDLNIIILFIQQMVRVDLWRVVMDVPTQDVISHGNFSVPVNTVSAIGLVPIQLCYLQTFGEITRENSSIIVVPVPIDTIRTLFSGKTKIPHPRRGVSSGRLDQQAVLRSQHR